MKLPGFVPEELRQLARFVPLRGWDAIEWKPLLGSMRSVSWRFVSGRGVGALRDAAREVATGITLVKTLDDAKPLVEVKAAAKLRRYGDEILRLYFAQWLLEDGLFLDLRPARFGLRGTELVYAPNGLWVELRPDFREGILALYRSFYSADDAAFEHALRQMGMLRPGLSEDAEATLKGLLIAHFGVEQSAQRFSIDSFKASFDDLFEFFIEHDYKLHSDFVWVGFYLITLYLTLQQGGQAHNVQKICSEILLKRD